FVVGHNIRAFDAHQLRGMGVAVAEECLVDTLELARCLFPDSVHHHLSALCTRYGIELAADERHTALPDARATVALLHAMSNDLATGDDGLVRGVRALVAPASAIDQVILEPRGLAADPRLDWELSPGFSPPHVTAGRVGNPPSEAMRRALGGTIDVLVEI